MDINSFIRLPEKMPCDKRMHFVVGVVFASVLVMVGIPVAMVGLLSVAFAWGIEIYQKVTGSGKFEHGDAIAVVIGAGCVLVPLLVGVT